MLTKLLSRRFYLGALVTLLTVLRAMTCQAQYYITEHILINEGLSNNYICDITLDNKGRVWIATKSGLYSYISNVFSTYNVSNSALSANVINCLWHDEETDLIWVGTKGAGLGCINPDKGEIVNYNVADNSLSNVIDITPAGNHLLWIISPDNIMLANANTGELTPVKLGEVNPYFSSGADDGNGNLIIGTHMGGAYVLNARTHVLTPLSTSEAEGQNVTINNVHKDHFGRIWLASDAGLWYYQPGVSHLGFFAPTGNQEIMGIQEINDQYLWLIMQDDLLCVNLETQQLEPIETEGELTLFEEIESIYQDRFNNIWIGSKGNGIEFISHLAPPFRKFSKSPVWGIYNDGSLIWYGSRDHLLAYNGTKCVHDIDLSSGGNRYGIVLSINGNGGDLLYLAVKNQMLSYNKLTGRINEITTPDGKSIDAITFYKENNGTFWITTSKGVYTLQNGYAVECQFLNEVLKSQSVHGVRRDKQGKLWVATYENGLYLFDDHQQLIKHLSVQTGFFTNSIQHLKIDSHDRLWMSTPDGPCCIPHTRYPELYVTYGYPDGLQDTNIQAILEDRKGNIWMSTKNGISMLDYEKHFIYNYNQKDFVPVNNLSGGAVLQDDGGLVFTSSQGLCLCYPDSLTESRPPLSFNLLMVEGMKSGEQSSMRHIVQADATGIFHFTPEEHDFRLYFGSEDYAVRRYLEYGYQIEGIDRDWELCTQNAVTFRDLQPGNYNIRIRSRLKGYPWSEEMIVRAKIIIHQPWWWTLWAKIAYVLLLSGIIYIGVRHYLYRVKLASQLELERRRNLVEHQNNAERLQFFTNVTHELKTPLTLIQAPLEELLQDNHLSPADQKRIQLVYDSSHRLTDLCNKLLDFRKSETHNQFLKVSSGNLGELIKEVGQSFIELNTNPQLNILVEVEENGQDILFDADTIRIILTNLLSNAMKYTPKGEVRLQERQYTKEGQLFVDIIVSDTGYGIPASALPRIFDRYYQVSGPHQASGTGIGLSIVRSLTELHKATIKAESTEGEGTTFTVTLNGNETYPDAMHALSQSMSQQAEENSLAEVIVEDDNRPLLLLVEDDFQILNFMSDSLSSEYRILRAHNGQEGLDLALEHMPDMVITDLMMPVMNGNTLCRKLKNDIRTSHIPIIMLTAKDTAEDQIEGYSDGADSYLTKPFSLTMLRTRLQNMITARTRLVAWINTHSVASTATTVVAAEEESSVPSLSVYDQNFLRDVNAYIIEHIETDSIRMEDLAQSMHISHSTLYRKIKALTGLTGAEFIRKVKIMHSAELMRSGHCNVSEAAYRCGFSNMAYFRSSFKEVFGVTPSEYQKQ